MYLTCLVVLGDLRSILASCRSFQVISDCSAFLQVPLWAVDNVWGIGGEGVRGVEEGTEVAPALPINFSDQFLKQKSLLSTFNFYAKPKNKVFTCE